MKTEYEYKTKAINNSNLLEKTLNAEAKDGWQLKCVADRFLIFERKRDFYDNGVKR